MPSPSNVKHCAQCIDFLIRILFSPQDLNAFFDLCGHSLKKLSFNGCNQGAFSDDQFIVLAAVFCPQLTTIDFSYAYGIRDSTVRALAESCSCLQSVKVRPSDILTQQSLRSLCYSLS